MGSKRASGDKRVSVKALGIAEDVRTGIVCAVEGAEHPAANLPGCGPSRRKFG